ncbi:hypothetical protein NKJ06_34130 [Mesorhizobium sp. M0293]
MLHRVTAGVHCNLVVNPGTVEAQVQGAAVMGLSMCLAGSAITLKAESSSRPTLASIPWRA